MQIDNPAPTEEESGSARTWAIIAGIAATFLLWGGIVFFVIGEKGPPDWDFSVVPDIPGESAYSTHTPFRPTDRVPGPTSAQPEPQHVMGPTSEMQKMEIPKK
ncbi:MAG: hypothetical protein WAW37_17680 [Syntrophobacteraceae bacterium]